MSEDKSLEAGVSIVILGFGITTVVMGFRLYTNAIANNQDKLKVLARILWITGIGVSLLGLIAMLSFFAPKTSASTKLSILSFVIGAGLLIIGVYAKKNLMSKGIETILSDIILAVGGSLIASSILFYYGTIKYSFFFMLTLLIGIELITVNSMVLKELKSVNEGILTNYAEALLYMGIGLVIMSIIYFVVKFINRKKSEEKPKPKGKSQAERG